MLNVNNIYFKYSRKGKTVLADFSLRLDRGGVYGLLGSNGAGKSTLLYLMSGLLTPMAGEVLLDGVDVRHRLPKTMSDLFIVPEEFDFPSISLRRYASINGAFYPRFSYDMMLENLRLFELDQDINIGKLSMGQKKKVALSFAMACNTKVLLLDEPTNGLDIPGKSAFRRFIAQSADENRIFVISTHQVRDVSRILDHILIVDNRRVLFDHSVPEVQSRLKFADTTDKSVIDSALFAAKGMGGAGVILPNDDGNDSELDLELLFDFAHTAPDALNSVFNENTISDNATNTSFS